MKTKTHARVLSWILSICMIAALIPAIPATTAEAADGDTLVYNFTGIVDQNVEIATAASNNANSDFNPDLFTYSTTSQTGSDPWKYKALYKTAATKAGIGITKTTGLYLFAKNQSEAYIFLTLQVPEGKGGYYKLTSDSYVNVIPDSSNKFEFSGILYDGEDYNTAAQKLTFTYVPTSTAWETVPLGTTYLAPGDYTIKLRAYTSTGNGKQFYCYTKNITMTEVSPAITSTENIPTVMAIDETIPTTFGVSVDNAAVINSVASDNSDVVSVVDNEDGTYTIAAVANGFATVTVKATYSDNIEISKDYNIAVRNAPAANEYIYYFSGMVNDTVTFFSETNTGKSPDNVPSYVDNTYTEKNLSSPWKIFYNYRNSTSYAQNNISLTPEGFNIAVNSKDVYVALALKPPSDGWYSVDTDYYVNTHNGTTAFRLYDGSNFVAQSNVAIVEDNSFDLKPVYLTANGTNAFYFATSSFPGTLNLYSMTLESAEPVLEAQTTVPTSYTVDDAPSTVEFKIGAMTPTSVTAASDSAAVTAAASGTAVTFTPVSAGTANVAVTATYGNKTVSDSYTITVSEASSVVDLVFGSNASGWTANSSSTATLEDSTAAGQNMKINTGKAFMVDFTVPTDGDYELVINSGECSDYGLNGEIWVDDVMLGRIHNDSNVGNDVIANNGVNVMRNKGFGKVTLSSDKTHTLKVVGLEPDMIEAHTRGSGTDRAGSVQFYISKATFTKVSDDVVNGIEITCDDTLSIGDTAKATAKVKMSDGTYSDAAVTFGYVTDPDGVITCDASGNITAVKAGRAIVEAEYEVNGVVYQEQVEIAVVNDGIFGNVYSYIENTGTDNKYKVNLLGAIKELDGYKQVGFIIYEGTDGYDITFVDSNKNAKATSEVYKKIKVSDVEYDATRFGATADDYIFCVSEEIEAGKTVVVRPYVVDESNNEIIYGKQYKMTVGQ